MERRYALLTFGCQMNIHDSERIAGLLEREGWREAEPEEADAIILVTCCVRESAERRLYGRLSALRPLKERNGALIAVGGCLAQKEGEMLRRKAPHVDLIFGTHQYPQIAVLLERAAQGAVCSTAMGGLSPRGLPARRREDFRAWVTITNGCDNFCSYCVVPYVRGEETSRPVEEVMREVGEHVAAGAREINLLGQNVDSYRRKEEGRSRFADLLRALGASFPEVWLRFTTSHPRDFDLEVMRAIAETPGVCEYVHLPLQAGSDRVLEAMRRGYGREEYLEKARALRREVEGVALSTDIIVGFPGESEEDFRDTLEMVELCRFDTAFTFVFNPRPGTPAAQLADDVPHEVKRERMSRLTALTRRLTSQALLAEVGRELEALVHGPSRRDPNFWAARTRRNLPLHFQRGGEDLTGRFVRVRVTGAGSWSLRGELLEVMG
ncbi:MAG: tRNA (N6-isopentenyl adenosine(37)-C2)-methylthiotransferase MiaB [Actinobacteria bacterium]|nr:tRNA (N6-isopentenyl adenosine(37)-C2)-methylthiotransferase MiaB [Actinomycetota bacterium]MDI6829864.1 tRNA (N6-isopentenyl adenosine(37)-C2)-methylthiotransferase MiaB [Actinomycetota bacterium]